MKTDSRETVWCCAASLLLLVHTEYLISLLFVDTDETRDKTAPASTKFSVVYTESVRILMLIPNSLMATEFR
jgi:hypothetical protein